MESEPNKRSFGGGQLVARTICRILQKMPGIRKIIANPSSA